MPSHTDILDLGPNWSDRRKAQREHVAAVKKETPPTSFYNDRLFRLVQGHRIGDNVSRLGVRQISDETGLAVGTVNAAINGKATKIDTLWTLARYFDIPWILLFDLNASIPFEVKEDEATGFRRVVIAAADPATPEPASRSPKAKQAIGGAMAKALDEAYVKWFKEDGSYPFNNGFEMGYKAALNATETPNPDSVRELVEAAIDDEPELPDALPTDMWIAVQKVSGTSLKVQCRTPAAADRTRASREFTEVKGR
jgi:transcriptional regulator with XRE-family HTH domain